MARFSLDTNVLLHYLLDDDPAKSSQIKALLQQAKPMSIGVADAVFLECVGVLGGPVYHMDRALIASLITGVAKIEAINCNRALLERAVPLYLKHPAISFTDACLVVYAELNDSAPLFTFDKALAKAVPKLATTKL